MIIPQELLDKIFLSLPYYALNNTRDLQSHWVIMNTMYDNMSDAVENCSKMNIIWLLNNNYPCDCIVFSKAIKRCGKETLILLRNRGCPWDEETLIYSIYRGDLEIIKWLLDNGCPYTCKSYDIAIKKGDIDIIKLLKPLWNMWTLYVACLKGNLELIKWLYNCGCPWNEYTSMGAYINGNKEVIEWIKITLK